MIRVVVISVALASFSPCVPKVSADTGRSERLFVKSVLPTFQAKCFACHGEDTSDVRGEFNMLNAAGLFRGGETGEPAVVPRDAANSPLVRAVKWADLEMPPKENDRLTDQQIADIQAWIDSGAIWPTKSRIVELTRSIETERQQEGVQVTTSGGLAPDWTNRRYDPEHLWAYQPLWKPDDPSDLLPGAIDTLIRRRLDEMGLNPAPPADRRTLIRRATFDLLGLPPTPGEVRLFLEDRAEDDVAFARVVDRLLESPHYGEHWARHWLDVVRYADTSGYANDYERGNAWRYRDYVVRALNSDKPYDQFVREQIAGDEMDPDDPEMLVAVGFLRMGPWELTGMEVPKVARQRFLDDVTDSVGQVFLGHMLQCARCHDHKFDPVPTRDYYAMQAVFATTQLAERQASFLPNENIGGFEEKQYIDQRMQFYTDLLNRVNQKETLQAGRKWLVQNSIDPSDFDHVVSDLAKHDQPPPSLSRVRAEMAKRGISADFIPPKKSGFQPKDFGLERIGRKGIQRLTWRLDRYEPFALSVYSGKTPAMSNVSAPLRVPRKPQPNASLEQTAILTGGDPFSPADRVQPGALSAASSIAMPTCTEILGRRRALADWITSAKNPLTARVMVNRIWQWHFGQGLVGTPNNFGATGKKPTHPKLLDWLAGQFIEKNWSVKAMHRQIMMSQTYRRSSSHMQAEKLAAGDPLGNSYAVFRPRRLSAEELRDAMLACSGELNRQLGGIPIRPEMNLEAALQPRMVMGTFAESWQPSRTPSQRHRRSLYAMRVRGQRDPFLEVFNSPASETSCEARDAATTTPQVFAMFNSEITFDRALAFADRLLRSSDSQEDTVRQAFQLAFARNPNQQELLATLQHWKGMTQRHRDLTFEPPQYPTEVVREAVEENTGVKFSFVEPLEVYRDFVPDLKPCDASPELRGLAEVCLVLMNSNEFAYVY